MAKAPSESRDRPWVFRTYSGHSSAAASNELYRTNLARGQTGLSVAFDLPTQTGYDSDHPLARGEVGKVGVPIGHIDDMTTLFDQIPLDRMNTSMTINASGGLAARASTSPPPSVRAYDAGPALRHHPERHHQGVSLPRHLRIPTGCLDAADQRRGGVQRRCDPQMESDQHLLLPPAGGRRDARAGDRVRDGERDGGARRREAIATTSPRRRSPRLRAHLLLPELRHPLRRGDLQVPRDEPRCGRRSGAQRYGIRRPEGCALPLWRSGQQPGA